MIYYIGLLFMLIICRLISASCRDGRRERLLFFAMAAAVVIAFQGLRSFSVGTDLLSYIPGFTKIGESRDIDLGNLVYQNYEAGYVLLNKLLYKLGFSERMFLIAVSAIIQIPIFYTMYKYSEKPLLSVLVYFAFGNFIFTFSGLRQSIAMSLCFYAYRFIKDRRLLPFVITIVIAACFHSSALVCIVLYPAYHMELDRRVLPFAIVAAALLLVLNEKLLILLSKFGYGGYGSVTRTGAYTMFIMYFLLYLLSFCGKKYDRDFMGLRNILLLLVLVFTLAPVSNYATRVAYPFTLYLTVFVPKATAQFDVRPAWVYNLLCCALCALCFMYFLGDLGTLPFAFGGV